MGGLRLQNIKACRAPILSALLVTPCLIASYLLGHQSLSRGSPDNCQTNANIRAFLALLQDQREVRIGLPVARAARALMFGNRCEHQQDSAVGKNRAVTLSSNSLRMTGPVAAMPSNFLRGLLIEPSSYQYRAALFLPALGSRTRFARVLRSKTRP